MRFKSLSALAAASALLPFLAQAEGLSYSYVEGAYINTDVDQFDEEVDGFALRGSFEVTDQVFLFAGYDTQSTSIFGTDLDLERFNLGGGYAWSIGPSADVYGKIGYVQYEADAGGFDVDDDGYMLGVGLRGRVAEQLELEGGLNYVDLSDSGDDTSVVLGARWFFTDQLAGGVEGEFGDDFSTYGINVRWDFGQ
jgi:hypothetical protein